MKKTIVKTILVVSTIFLASCNSAQEDVIMPTKTISPIVIPSLSVTVAPSLTPIPTRTQTFVPTQTQEPTPFLQITKRAEFQVSWIDDVAWSFDNTKLAICGSVDDLSGLYFYNVDTFHPLLFIPELGCLDIAYSLDGNALAVTTGDQFEALKVWDTNTGNLITKRGGNTQTMVSFTTDPDVVITCGSIGARSGPYTTFVHSFTLSAKDTGTILQHDGWLMSCSLSENDELLAVGLHRIQSGDKWDQVVLWDLVSSEVACYLDGVEAVLSPSGKLIGTNDYDGNIVIWDTETCQPKLRVLGDTNLPVMTISSDDKMFAYVGISSVYLLELDNSELRINLQDTECSGGYVGNLSFSPDNESLIATCLYDKSEARSAELLFFDILR